MRIGRPLPFLLALLALPGVGHATTVAADNLIVSPFQDSGFYDGIGYKHTTNGGFANTAAAQPFTSLASGPLASITSFISVWGGGDPLRVAIHQRTFSSVGPRLGFVEFPQTMFPTNYATDPPTVLDMSGSGVSLIAGESYFVVLSTQTPIFGTPRYNVHIMPPTAKSFGMPYWDSRDGIAYSPTSISQIRPGSYELPLLVEVVPEPCTLVMAMLGCATLVARRASGKARSQGRSPA